MKGLTPNQKLDTVLNYIKNHDVVYKDELIKRMDDLSITRVELGRIIYRLIDDKNITENPSLRPDKIPFYVATFDGFLFESYVQHAKQATTSNRNEYIRTLLLTYGTALAGVYGLFEILKWVFHHFHWALLI
jgi:hypothetical protein